MIEKPPNARLYLHMKMVGVRLIIVRREDVRENAEIERLADERSQLARVRLRGDGDAVAAGLIANVALEMLGDAEPAAVAFVEQSDVDREACGVSGAWRRPGSPADVAVRGRAR